jgi:tetratricopeptide (TPR) repeat protein
MRHVSLCGAISVATIVLAAPANLNAATWCLVTRDGSSLCRFQTFQQCMQSRSGQGDSCAQDSSTQAAPAKPRAKATTDTATKPQPDAAKSKEQPAKQVAPAKAPSAPTPAPQATTQQDQAKRFAAARDLVLAGKYEDGIAALRALGFDQHPDVATYVGLALNKLGYKAEAIAWYDKALAGNPKHLLTLSYYGMLRAEQGDLVRAQQDLETIKAVCGGTTCKEYIALEATIASKKR